jgi:IS5 family transposase
VDADNRGVQIIHRGKIKGLSKSQRRWLKRRQAVEPVIGHLKHDNAMDRCWLKGQTGDALHADVRGGLQHLLAAARDGAFGLQGSFCVPLRLACMA